jgi:hypothetical protein
MWYIHFSNQLDAGIGSSGMRFEEMKMVVAFFHGLDDRFAAAHAVAQAMSNRWAVARGSAA